MESPQRRIIEGEKYGAPVPGSWPGGRRQDDAAATAEAPTARNRRKDWLDRLRRRKTAGS